MAVEMEYKFLISSLDRITFGILKEASIEQFYLSRSDNNSIRLRIVDNKSASLTIKSSPSLDGVSRQEFEYNIPIKDALEMKHLSDTNVKKIRYRVQGYGHEYPSIIVDVFKEKLKGLIIAEIEVKSLEDYKLIPNWLTCDVTSIPQFKNDRLSLTTFKELNKDFKILFDIS